MPSGRARRISDVGMLQALTHPLRLRLFYALTAEREATASRLAELVDESVSLVSYHLRELAAHGLIEDAPRRSGDRRERWWRRRGEALGFQSSSHPDDAPRRAVRAAVKRHALAHQISQIERWIDAEPTWDDAWSAAAFATDSLLRLTPAELGQLGGELQAVVRRWAERSRDGGESGPDDAERKYVMLIMHGIPFAP